MQWRIQDFPYGEGAWTSNGGVDSRGGYISKILYAKTKKSGPLGGGAPGHAPSRSANEMALPRESHHGILQTSVMTAIDWELLLIFVNYAVDWICSPVIGGSKCLLKAKKVSSMQK